MGLQAVVDRLCTVHDLLIWTRKSSSAAGKPVYNLKPLERKCRWDNKRQQITTRDGRIITSNALILSPDPIPEGALVFKGSLADWKALPSYPSLPTPLEGGYEVMSIGSHDDFDGSDLLHLAYL